MVEGEGLMAIQFLDLWDKLVNEVFGSPVLFLIALLFGIIIISATTRMNNRITIMLVSITALIISYFIDKVLAVVLLLVLAGVGLAYARFISRG
jgi:hypothetical protein